MKIIHAADLHLGSQMNSKLPREKARERRGEILNTFLRTVQYAKDRGIRAVLLSGDVFDSERPLQKDRLFFWKAIRNCPEIDFFYLRGNHDRSGGQEDLPENLKLFGEEWTTYSLGDVTVSGLELSPENRESYYMTLALSPEKKNLVMLHGQVGSGADEINLLKLKNLGIDYLALGHVHSYGQGPLDNRGIWAYSGCLEGRGFDETGEKGFLVLDTENPTRPEFVPFASRKVVWTEADVTGAEDAFELREKVRQAISADPRDLVRVTLTGRLEFDCDLPERIVSEALKEDYYYLEVQNKAKRNYSAESVAGEVSLRGEFIRRVLADPTLSEEDREMILAAGLQVLGGGEAEI